MCAIEIFKVAFGRGVANECPDRGFRTKLYVPSGYALAVGSSRKRLEMRGLRSIEMSRREEFGGKIGCVFRKRMNLFSRPNATRKRGRIYLHERAFIRNKTVYSSLASF